MHLCMIACVYEPNSAYTCQYSKTPLSLSLPTTAALSLFLVLSVSLSIMSILATLFYGFPHPTNISMYLMIVIGASYGISRIWELTLTNVKPPGMFVRTLRMYIRMYALTCVKLLNDLLFVPGELIVSVCIFRSTCLQFSAE